MKMEYSFWCSTCKFDHSGECQKVIEEKPSGITTISGSGPIKFTGTYGGTISSLIVVGAEYVEQYKDLGNYPNWTQNGFKYKVMSIDYSSKLVECEYTDMTWSKPWGTTTESIDLWNSAGVESSMRSNKYWLRMVPKP